MRYFSCPYFYQTRGLTYFERLAEYLEGEPARKRAAAEAQKAKLEALERKLGITPSGSSEASTSRPTDGPAPEPLAGKKHRFDDTEYLEQSREIVDNVKSAVTAGESRSYVFLYPSSSICAKVY